MGHSAPVVQKKASSNGFSISFPMSKEIENEKASSNGFSVSFPLAKEEEMGNKKASSNGISISFPMEAEMEKYDDGVKKLFNFILDRTQSKEEDAQSTWNIPLGNPFKKAEADNLLNIGLVHPRPFKKAGAEGPWSISYTRPLNQAKAESPWSISFKNAENAEEESIFSPFPSKETEAAERVASQTNAERVKQIIKILNGLGGGKGEQADEQFFPQLIGSLLLSKLSKGKK